MASIYESDIKSRFPLDTVEMSTDGDVHLCTVTVTSGGAAVTVGVSGTADGAAHNARLHLGVPDDILCCLTTTERDALSAPLTGLQVFNTTTGAAETYTGSGWV